MATNPRPKRGEVWWVNFDPTIGAEIKEKRPAVVISSDAVGRLPIKLIAPITHWNERYARCIWHVRVDTDSRNGLKFVSSVDTLQLKGAAIERFVSKLGYLNMTTMDEIAAAIAAVVEYT